MLALLDLDIPVCELLLCVSIKSFKNMQVTQSTRIFSPILLLFLSLEETDHEIHLMMQFLIPCSLLGFESRDDRRMLLQQDQQATQCKGEDWDLWRVFQGTSGCVHCPNLGTTEHARRFGTTCTRWFLHLL